mmetsp:Transcript_28349/g.68085  ORF Transcript_28349/g.68085 Transcript_28349/m.68085 type:complete len:216 (-) Transcript_28349:65-712(-)
MPAPGSDVHPLQRQHRPRLEVLIRPLSPRGPDSHVHLGAAGVRHAQLSLEGVRPLLGPDRLRGQEGLHHHAEVHRAGRGHLRHLLQRDEPVLHLLDVIASIVVARGDVRVGLEPELVVVGEVAVPLVAHADGTTAEGENLGRLQHLKELVRRRAEEGSPDLTPLLVQQVHAEDLAAPGVGGELAHGGPVGHARLDLPHAGIGGDLTDGEEFGHGD